MKDKSQFKTNINCGGCEAKIKPHLDNLNGICHWEVDLANRDKVLTVESEGITSDEIVEVGRKAGFKLEQVN